MKIGLQEVHESLVYFFIKKNAVNIRKQQKHSSLKTFLPFDTTCIMFDIL